MTTYTYRCFYNFIKSIRFVDSEKGVRTFSEGFWINDILEHTTGSDCAYWIPPSQILYIEKVRKDENE